MCYLELRAVFFSFIIPAFTRGSRQEYTSTDPSFTMRRKMEHLREEMEQIGLLRQVRPLTFCLCICTKHKPKHARSCFCSIVHTLMWTSDLSERYGSVTSALGVVLRWVTLNWLIWLYAVRRIVLRVSLVADIDTSPPRCCCFSSWATTNFLSVSLYLTSNCTAL